MNQRAPFISFDLRQPVNQWLGLALVSLMCFWVVLYYFTTQSQIIAENYTSKIMARAEIPSAKH